VPPRIDIVVVTYNSEEHIEECLAALVGETSLRPIVVDNDSSDATVELVERSTAELIRSVSNVGFARGCNVGWRTGNAPFVLFLNPDARISSADALQLASILEGDESIGLVGPRILDADGTVAASQRRFPTLGATIAHAFFLHRLFPRSRANSDIADPAAYSRAGSPDWVSGACLMVRREVLERLDGFDERFFMYYEDMDLCRRARAIGYDILYEPRVTVFHEGAASAPRPRMIHVMSQSELRYADKHNSGLRLAAERSLIALDKATHAIFTTQGSIARRAFLHSAIAALQRRAADD
jgi:hypothetical protein